MRPGPGHQASPCCTFGQREASTGAPVAPGPGQPGKDSEGGGLCLHRSATRQREQTGVLVAPENRAGPPGWEPPLGTFGSILGRTSELAEALHRGPAVQRCAQRLVGCPWWWWWEPCGGVRPEKFKARERVTDSVIPMSSAGNTSFQPKGEDPAVLL